MYRTPLTSFFPPGGKPPALVIFNGLHSSCTPFRTDIFSQAITNKKVYGCINNNIVSATFFQLSQTPKISLRMQTALRFSLLAGLFLCFSSLLCAQVAPADQGQADTWARKYKDDDVLCRSSYHFFTFDKGVNALNDKVVTILEEAEIEFIGLKKFSGVSYAEFYNKFIRLKTFKKDVKVGNKYITSGKAGIDRSLTDENIFFDDSRVQYYPLRFQEKGSVARVIVKKDSRKKEAWPA
jgi:hypothetical protein